MHLKAALISILVLIVTPAISKAAAYWLTVNGNGKVGGQVIIQLYYGSINDYGVRIPNTEKELKLAGDFKFEVIDEQGERTPVSLFLQSNCWQGSFIPKHPGLFRILGLNNQHPVIDRSATGGINVLPIDYICAAYIAGDASANPSFKSAQQLDISVVAKDKLLHVTAFLNSTPCKTGTKLRVFNPDNWEKELILDENGTAKFYPTIKGLYIIRLDWEEPKTGTYNGKTYENIRHRCNFFWQSK